MGSDSHQFAAQPQLEQLLPLLGGSELAFFYGVGESGELLHATLLQESPLLLLGWTGSGKTCLASAILRQLYEVNGPDKLQVVFVDNDRGISFLFEGQPQTSFVAYEMEDVYEALQRPFTSQMAPGMVSPYWLIVIDGWEWLQQDRASYNGGRIWSAFRDLPARFAQEEPKGFRGGVMLLSSQETNPFTTPFQTRVRFPDDQIQRALEMDEETVHPFLRQLYTSSIPWQFVVEHRLPDNSIEVKGPFLSPESTVTSPWGNREGYW